VRPTLDRVREAWMSIVQGDLPGARVLDLFAGSGALGLEALSRGAETADFVDLSPVSLRAVQENVASLGAETRARIVRAEAAQFAQRLAANSYDVAFADPPFSGDGASAVAAAWLAAPFAAVLGIEHAAGAALPAGGDTRRYGTVAITFYR